MSFCQRFQSFVFVVCRFNNFSRWSRHQIFKFQFFIYVLFQLNNNCNQIHRCRWFFDFVYLLICRNLSHLFFSITSHQKRVCRISTRFIFAAFDNDCNLFSAFVNNDNSFSTFVNNCNTFSASVKIVDWSSFHFYFCHCSSFSRFVCFFL